MAKECMLCCAETNSDRFQKVYKNRSAHICERHVNNLREIIKITSVDALLYCPCDKQKTPPILVDDLWL